MRYLLYNPLSGKTNQSFEGAKAYASRATMPVELVDITKINIFRDFFETLESCDDVVVFGGDGSLNKVANALCDVTLANDIYYFPCGTGNDFARDVDQANAQEPFLINEYIQNLPTVTVNGKSARFINGIGFGIDGYCCEVGDRLKAEGKQPDYTAIAIKGLLYAFKPVTATVVVDGKETKFKKTWIAPTMFGRFYGGGMMPTPEQKRNAEDRQVSLMVFHGSGKLKTLMIFPSLFEGKHVEKKKHVSILQGKRITVAFDRPTALQIDGETVLNVTEYTVEI